MNNNYKMRKYLFREIWSKISKLCHGRTNINWAACAADHTNRRLIAIVIDIILENVILLLQLRTGRFAMRIIRTNTGRAGRLTTFAATIL